jgi:hypothetical protein
MRDLNADAFSTVPDRRGRRVLTAAALAAGAVAALAGVSMIWLARASIHRAVYVSELGAKGMNTATDFAIALLLVAFGGALIAVVGRHPRAPGILGAWTIGATIALSSVFFVVASQVSCTAGCPLPILSAASTMQDLVHTVCAVLGFASGCLAMLQLGVIGRGSVMARVSLAACALVGVITIIGGLLSIFGTASDVGGVLEFIGTTVAVTWLAAYGLWLAWRLIPAAVAPSDRADAAVATYERPAAINLSS